MIAQGVRHSPRANAMAQKSPRPARLAATRVPGCQGRVNPTGSTIFPVARTITTHIQANAPLCPDQPRGCPGRGLRSAALSLVRSLHCLQTRLWRRFGYRRRSRTCSGSLLAELTLELLSPLTRPSRVLRPDPGIRTRVRDLVEARIVPPLGAKTRASFRRLATHESEFAAQPTLHPWRAHEDVLIRIRTDPRPGVRMP